MYSPDKTLDFLECDTELGAAPAKKAKKAKRRGKVKKALKKVGKVAAAVATGGVSLAIKGGIGAKAKEKLKKAGKAVAGVLDDAANLAVEVTRPEVSPEAEATFDRVENTTAGDCNCKDEMAKLVAAKLTMQLGPPLTEANRLLAKFDLQRQATYEHQKLMSDDEFRKKVLAHLVTKANQGNVSCRRTINLLRRSDRSYTS